jgi:hypothetical protein
MWEQKLGNEVLHIAAVIFTPKLVVRLVILLILSQHIIDLNYVNKSYSCSYYSYP